MAKEMIVSSSSHEAKIAILEDDQLVEVYFEREKEYTLAGSIYRGRVTRVLPGMQSAFVDIGLERDAFLYVSDFFEDTEEYDQIAATVEEKVLKMDEKGRHETTEEAAPAASAEASAKEVQPAPPPERERAAAPASEESASGRRGHGRRSRRHRSRHRKFPESKYAGNVPPSAEQAPEAEPAPEPILLPGESLAKYRQHAGGEQSAEQPETGAAFQAATGLREEREQSTEGLSGRGLKPEGRSGATEESGTANVPVEVVPRSVSASVQTARPAADALDTKREAPETVGAERALEESLEGTPLPVGKAVSEGQEEVRTSSEEEAEGNSSNDDPTAMEDSDEPAELEMEETAVVSGSPEEEAAEEAGNEEEEGGSADEEARQPREAAVRERSRNPRYQRKSRWAARKARQDSPRQGGRPKEQTSPNPLIADLLKEGQEIIVQIAKEPLGKKGARITSHIALPGRYVVYMPTVSHAGVSRKISSEEERQRLKRIILEHSKGITGGFIVRTAGEGRSEEDLRQDVLFLSNLWAEIKAKAEKSPAPALLHHDLNLVLRMLRDQLSEDFRAVWVDNEQEYERIVSLVSKFNPALISRVKLYTKDTPIFEELGIQEEINKALKPKVWLKSGGYIVINQTEALVAIDVNTGKFVGRSNRLEDTIVKTNVDAIQEIVRQIRLRDLGGIIVIDFIDMDERKNRQKVMAALEEALRADRAPSKTLAFNEFGLVAITRKRVRQSLERTLSTPCPYCTGSGLVKSVPTMCNEILAEARKMAAAIASKQITLRVNPEVARALKSRDNTTLQEIEELTGKTVIIRSEPSLHMESFDFH